MHPWNISINYLFASDLFTVLFEHPELKALVELVPLQLPQLQQLLLTAVNLVQQLHYLNNSFVMRAAPVCCKPGPTAAVSMYVNIIITTTDEYLNNSFIKQLLLSAVNLVQQQEYLNNSCIATTSHYLKSIKNSRYCQL